MLVLITLLTKNAPAIFIDSQYNALHDIKVHVHIFDPPLLPPTRWKDENQFLVNFSHVIEMFV